MIFRQSCKFVRPCKSMITLPEKLQHLNKFKKNEFCLPESWIVVRLDGVQFSRFTDFHAFDKPNDIRALQLMNRAAAKVMEELKDICLAFGQSDEYSFVLKKDTDLFDRNRDTICTVVSSLFTSAYVFYWDHYFGYSKLLYPPGFDCRVVLYPCDSNLRDYLSWRQADVHINNLYNTVFWALVKKGKHSRRKAQEMLRGTLSRDKNEILFKDYGINYNNEPMMFRKGTTLVRKLVRKTVYDDCSEHILQLNCDIIGDSFWEENFEILSQESPQLFQKPDGMIGYEVANEVESNSVSIVAQK